MNHQKEADLLLRLRRFTPREGRDPLEDYLTESFYFLLAHYPPLAQALADRLSLPALASPRAVWETQKRTHQGIMDMVCLLPERAIIFEHKTHSTLHSDQLLRYRAWGEETHPTPPFLVLVTARRDQFSDRADACMTWSEVYTLLEQVELADPKLRDCFLSLLRAEGFGPSAPISHQDVKTYIPSIRLERALEALMEEAMALDWSQAYALMGSPTSAVPYRRPKTGSPKVQDGRIGLDLVHSWVPGVFLGVLLDGTDHKVSPSDPDKGPDMCLILSLENAPERQRERNAFLTSPGYLAARERLAKDTSHAYDIHDHLLEHPDPNPWHILHVRKPLLDVMAMATSLEQQRERFYEEAMAMLSLVFRPDELGASTPSDGTEGL